MKRRVFHVGVAALAVASAAACGLGVAGSGASVEASDAAPTSTSTRLDAATDSYLAPIDAGPSFTLTVSESTPAATAALDTLGPKGWVHWGRSNSSDIDRMAGMDPTLVLESLGAASGTPNLEQFGDDVTSFTWQNGSPTQKETGTTTGVDSKSSNNPYFMLVLSADSILRQALLYVGGYKVDAQLTVTIGSGEDSSTVTKVASSTTGNFYELFTIGYSANASVVPLTITWTLVTSHDSNGNVTLSSIALQ